MAQNPSPSKLDPHQIQQRSFDEASDRIRVDAVASIEPGSMEVVISETDDSILVYGNDGTTNRKLKTDATGELQVDIKNDAGNPVPISASSLPLPTGAATAALQTQPGVDIGDVTINNTGGADAVNIQDGGNSITVDGTVSVTQSGTWDINNISGTVSLPTGAATESTLSTLNSKVPSDLTVTSTRLLVDGSGVTQPISGTVSTNQITSSTAVLTNVASTISSITLLAANANRKQAMFYNDSTKTLYLKLGTTASNTSFTVLLVSGAYYELPYPVYTGRIDGIWASANGACRVTELT